MENEITKKSFVLYCDTYESIKELPIDDKGSLLDAIFLYSTCGQIPKMSGLASLAFSFIKQSLDRDFIKWNNKCLKNRENGRLGGRPKTNKKTQENQTQANGLLNNPNNLDNDNGSESDINFSFSQKKTGWNKEAVESLGELGGINL